MLELKHISKTFQDRIILDDISITFPDVGMIGIQGESGCGKSTLLYIIGMLDTDFQGEILYNGEFIKDKSAFIRQHVSYMMQNKDMISSLTLKENIVLPCQVSHLFYNSNQLNKITMQLDIHSLLTRFPSQLSGGQLKRASIAKALLKQSSLILADEPTGALHSMQAHSVMKQLQKLSQTSLVIVVSHDPLLLKEYCDYILTLQNGQLIGKLKKKKSISVSNQKSHYYSLAYYPMKQLLYQRNKLMFLFLFQWIVIVAFFLIVTAMNGVFDAIEQSETQSVLVNMMSIERKDGQNFEQMITHPLIQNIQYELNLEQINVTNQNQSLSCVVHLLPTQQHHMKLHLGRFPQSKDEVIVTNSLYQSLKEKESLQLSYSQYYHKMKIVGVLMGDFFDSQEVYCLSFLEDIPELRNTRVLSIEAKADKARELYQALSKDYHVYSDIIERVDNYQSVLSLARFVAYIFVGVSFLISLLLIAIVESIIYLERQHDVAYLLSLGISHKRLFFLSFMEAVFMGLIMGIGGSILSGLIYYYLNDIYQIVHYFHIQLVLKPILISSYDIYIVIVVFYMLMTMLGSLLPMKKMMKTKMIDVLREE